LKTGGGGGNSLPSSLRVGFNKAFSLVSKSFALLTLLLAFLFVGCDSGSSDDGDNGDVTTYSVSFYDNELDLIETRSISKGEINPSTIITGKDWYRAEELSPTTNHNLTANVNFYNVPNVYEIYNEINLTNVRNELDGKYILMNDIELTSVTLDDLAGWEPIGDINGNSFVGIFNGNGHKITGLWVDDTDLFNAGLFSYIENAKIKNLGVIVASGKEIKSGGYAGVIAAMVVEASITNSYSEGNVSGVYGVGGITGYFQDSNITDCSSTGDISGDNNVGGIVGESPNYNIIANCRFTGNISGNRALGGIAGFFSGLILDSHSTGERIYWIRINNT
jgi:hypothetical protein